MAQQDIEYPFEEIDSIETLLNAKQYEEGLKLLNTLLEKKTDISTACLLKAETLWDLDKKRQAYEWYKKTINLAPKWHRAYRLYGYSLIHDGYKQEAYNLYTQGIIQMPQNAEIYFERGSAAEFLENYEQAMQDFNQAISVEKKQPKPNPFRLTHYYYRRSRLWLKQKNYEQTLLDLNAMIQVNPNNHDNYNTRASFYINNFEDYAKALPDYEKALVLASKPFDIKRYKNRIKDCKEEIAYSHYKTGDSLFDQKKYAESIEWAHKALALAPAGGQAANWAQELLNLATQKLNAQQQLDSLRREVTTMYAQGMKLIKNNQYPEGLKILAQVQALHKQNISALEPLRYMLEEIFQQKAKWKKIQNAKYLKEV